MGNKASSKSDRLPAKPAGQGRKRPKNQMNAMTGHNFSSQISPKAKSAALEILSFLDDCSDELEGLFDLIAPNPHLRMMRHLLDGHFSGKTVTPTALIGASRVPYATANRKLKEMIDAGLIEQRPRTKSGKSFSMHPSDLLLDQWMQVSGRVRRLAEATFGELQRGQRSKDYYFGGSYTAAQSIPPLSVLPEPLGASGFWCMAIRPSWSWKHSNGNLNR